jgi:hypothetical protein
MLNETHRSAQEMSMRAEALMRVGKPEEAGRLYMEAATKEQAAFEAIPDDKPRTRGILAVSWVALLYKAGAYEEAYQAARNILDQHLIPGPARSQIQDILRTIREEQALNTDQSIKSDLLNQESPHIE